MDYSVPKVPSPINIYNNRRKIFNRDKIKVPRINAQGKIIIPYEFDFYEPYELRNKLLNPEQKVYLGLKKNASQEALDRFLEMKDKALRKEQSGLERAILARERLRNLGERKRESPKKPELRMWRGHGKATKSEFSVKGLRRRTYKESSSESEKSRLSSKSFRSPRSRRSSSRSPKKSSTSSRSSTSRTSKRSRSPKRARHSYSDSRTTEPERKSEESDSDYERPYKRRKATGSKREGKREGGRKNPQKAAFNQWIAKKGKEGLKPKYYEHGKKLFKELKEKINEKFGHRLNLTGDSGWNSGSRLMEDIITFMCEQHAWDDTKIKARGGKTEREERC